MTELLSRLFIRRREQTGDPAVRAAYGTMVSLVCILLNFLVSLFKLIFGTLLGSIAMAADGVNNLSDAGASVVTLISFRIASKPADREHPFGHARIEYVSSMVVAFLVLLVGFELGKTSVEKIFAPATPDTAFLVPSMIVLGVSILIKLWMGLFNRKIGRLIDSSVMRATATDCLLDCISTLAVLLATVTYAVWQINLDAYLGFAVALLIFVAGLRILNDTKNAILGEKPVDELVESILRIVRECPEALGVHDLMVHSYGPGHTVASLHVEVDGARDVYETHDAIDNIERRLTQELGIQATIHTDPLVIGDPEVDRLHGEVAKIAIRISPDIRVHDFRLVRGSTHSNLIFDMAVPFECRLSDSEVREKTEAAVRALNARYYAVITIDRV